MKKKNNIRIYHLLVLSIFIGLFNSCSKDEVNPVPIYYSSIAAGFGHSLAIEPDGTLWAWGSNIFGQAGNGSEWGRNTPGLVGLGYAKIDAGRKHSMAIKTDGTLWVWGSNEYGQLGDGTTSNRNVPVQIGGN